MPTATLVSNDSKTSNVGINNTPLSQPKEGSREQGGARKGARGGGAGESGAAGGGGAGAWEETVARLGTAVRLCGWRLGG